jgi:hypothetical protein
MKRLLLTIFAMSLIFLWASAAIGSPPVAQNQANTTMTQVTLANALTSSATADLTITEMKQIKTAKMATLMVRKTIAPFVGKTTQILAATRTTNRSGAATYDYITLAQVRGAPQEIILAAADSLNDAYTSRHVVAAMQVTRTTPAVLRI